MPIRGLLIGSSLITALFFGWIAWIGYFFSDDFTWLWHGQKLLANLPAIFTAHMSSFYSPVVNTYFTFLLPVFGTWAPGYYLVNLSVHALVAWLCGVFAWQATRSRTCAFGVMTLVALVGSAYEPIVWIASNLHSIATLFIVTACVSYYAFLETKKILPALVCFCATALAFLTKEIAIVTPALLLLTGIILHRGTSHTRISGYSHAILIGSIATITALYGYQEYLWQQGGYSVSSGIWTINAVALSHYPYALMQMIAPIERIMSLSTAPWIFWIGIVGWLSLFLLSRSRPLAIFGLLWMVISLFPVIFFSDPESPFLIASRYTYLARIGLIFVLIELLAPLLRSPRTILKTTLAISVLALVAVPHLLSLNEKIRTEYAYVFGTGRTLVPAIRHLNDYPGYTMVVSHERPFDNNDAAIVGAASVIAHIPESRIIFLEKNEKKTLKPREALLAWDAAARSFTFTAFGQ